MWACERGVAIDAVAQNGEISALAAVVLVACLVVLARVLRNKLRSCCYTPRFEGSPFKLLLYARVLRKSVQSNANRKGCKDIFTIYCYMQGFKEIR